jgi:hypothetical protein
MGLTRARAAPMSRAMAWREARKITMFGIEWLKGDAVVERETSMSADLNRAIASAQSRAAAIRKMRGSAAPDRFRVYDRAGKEIRVIMIEGLSDADRT